MADWGWPTDFPQELEYFIQTLGNANPAPNYEARMPTIFFVPTFVNASHPQGSDQGSTHAHPSGKYFGHTVISLIIEDADPGTLAHEMAHTLGYYLGHYEEFDGLPAVPHHNVVKGASTYTNNYVTDGKRIDPEQEELFHTATSPENTDPPIHPFIKPLPQ